MPYFDSKYGKTFYFEQGKKSKKSLPVLALHGGPGGTHRSQFSLTWLKDERKVILYDQIGSGKSGPLNKKDMKVSTIVENLSDLIDHLKLDEFHLLGSSWGTTLALEYYLKSKGKGIKSIIFQSPMFSTKIWSNDAKRLIKALKPETQKIIKNCEEVGATDSKVYKKAVDEYYSKHVLRLKKLPEWYPEKYPNKHGEFLYQTMWGPSEFCATGSLKNYDRFEDLKKINVPVLLMCGQYDEATPEALARFQKKIPQAQIKIIKGASHSVLTEKPELAHKAIQSFLKGVEG